MSKQGRPAKDTVDWFPHQIKDGKTIFNLKNKFGSDGYAFWFQLLEILGGTKGLYLNCNHPGDWQFLIGTTGIGESKAKEILIMLSELEAIDPELWQHRVIWSQNFVDGIERIFKKRGCLPPTKPELPTTEKAISDTERTLSGPESNPPGPLHNTTLHNSKTYCPSSEPTDTTLNEEDEIKQQEKQLIDLFNSVPKDTQKLIKEYIQLFKTESMRANKRDIQLSKKLRLLSELVDLQKGAGKFDGKIITCSQEQFRIALEEVCNREFSSRLQNHNYLKRVVISTVNKGDKKIWAAGKTKLFEEFRQNKGVCPECGGETKRNVNVAGKYQMYCQKCKKGSEFYWDWEYQRK